MITNPLLEEIWAVKDRLAAEAGNDIHVFCEQLRAWESSHLPKGRVLRTPQEIRALRARQGSTGNARAAREAAWIWRQQARMRMKSKVPRCIVIAGPNGAGKTTFAREFLPREAGIVHFVNADLIAAGLSPLKPELAALAGGRLLLSELDRLAAARADFAFESTLEGP